MNNAAANSSAFYLLVDYKGNINLKFVASTLHKALQNPADSFHNSETFLHLLVKYTYP